MPGTSLAGALPELLAAEAKLRARGRALGIEFVTADYGGIRTAADTARIMAYRDADWAAAVKRDPSLAKRTTKQAWRPIAPFGSSYHNYGAAFDVRVVKWPAGKSAAWALEQLQKLAPSCGLRSGVTFSAERRDPPHMELPITLLEARLRWAARGNTAGLVETARDVGSVVGVVVVGLGLFLLARARGA